MRRAMTFAVKRQKPMRVVHWLLLVLALIIPITYFLDPDAFRGTMGILCVVMLLMVMIIYPLLRFGLPRFYARNFIRKQPGFQGLQRWTFSDSGVDVHSDFSEAHTKWGLYVGWAEDTGVILLYLSSHLYHLIPKRCLNDDQSRQLMALLNRYLGPS